jgi:hypothetical protein
MKFALLMVTRGNPKRAAAAIECAKALSSGKHEIDVIVGCDNDDAKTHSFLHQYKGLRLSIADRPTGVGAVWNRCASEVKADIYCPLPDDIFVSCPDWDEVIVSSGAPILAWNDLTNAGQCTLPIVSREWLELTGQLYDDRFPFWFYDTCVDELYTFVTGQRIPIPKALTFVSKKGLTQNLRELPFWWDFYVATRQERLLQAIEIRRKLGINLDRNRIEEALRMWERRDVIGRTTAQEIESGMSAEGLRAPSQQYLKARQDAAAYLELKAA